MPRLAYIDHGAAMHWLLPVSTASLLAFAVVTKTWEAFSNQTAIDATLTGAILAAAQILCESLLLAWIIGGWHATWLRRCCCSVFAVFAGVAGWRWFGGETSCGCFGAIHVPPAITCLLDLTLSLVWSRSVDGPGATRFRNRSGLVVAVVCAGIAVLIAVPWRTSPADVAATAPDPELRQGHWIVVAYRTDCSHCRRDFPTWLGEARRAVQRRPGRGQAATRWAFARLDPGRPDDLWPVDGLGDDVLNVDWPQLVVGTTPMALELRDGRLVSLSIKPWR